MSGDNEGKSTQVRPEPNGRLVLHKLLDNQFMEMGRLPLPENWILNNGKAAMSGPGNVNVFMLPLKTFTFSNDPMMREVYRQSGAPMRPFYSMDQVVQEDLMPTARQEGSQLVRQYDAPEDRYEESKGVVLNALANVQYNPEYVRAYNQGEMAREQSSWAGHQQRMQANKAAFEAQQRTFHEKNDAINASIAATYAQNSATSDRIHHRSMNAIKEEETVRNTADGQRYQVQAGATRYWMNDSGQYVPSNDPNYDPNRDPRFNHQQWKKADIENP
ncbi:hypothetical protein D7Y13_34835 [Corallococcus praedator]|uniref:Uncharacterized protein n=1 Tax=Corallococcus praedator TaxID=2316724 RepID=A0ABX9Q7A0_9BACT|nr:MULTISPECIES: hypothetical protein [Corallococcus]RKH35870.1 hypothetical protein D7X75_02340 [Corallococcus sp. CA031C]RKH93140.1 hypothetical protein D7Y13_34835 [Corallococcus praedator]